MWFDGMEFSFINDESKVWLYDHNGSYGNILESYIRAYLITSKPRAEELRTHENVPEIKVFHMPAFATSSGHQGESYTVHLYPATPGCRIEADGLEEVKHFSNFFKEGTARLYRDDVHHISVVTYTDNVSLKRLIATFPMWIAWDAQATIAPELSPVSVLLQNDASDAEIESALEAVFAASNVKGTYYRKMFSALPGIYEKVINEYAETELSQIEGNIASYMNRLKDLYNRRITLQMQIIGGQKIAEEIDCGDTLVKYFEKNPNIKLLSMDDREIKVSIIEPLKYWDEMLLQRHINNPMSRLYAAYPEQEAKGIRRFWTAVNDGEAVIYLIGVYALAYRGEAYADYINQEEGAYPNPHLKIHGCLGENRPAIEEPLRRGQLIQALEQCRVSAASINFSEGPTAEPFFKSFINTKIHCVSVRGGDRVTPKEAIKILEG